MDREDHMLIKRASWLLEHGYMHGDVYKIAEALRYREEIQKKQNADK